MMKLIAAAIAVAQLVPAIIDIVKSIEVRGNGPEKAAAVVAILREVFAILPEEVSRTIGIDKVDALLKRIVDIVVAFLNKVGVFNK